MKFRHKPTVITAIQLKGTATIATPTGEQTGTAGDWLVERDGDQYIITADIFPSLYSAVPSRAKKGA